MVHNLAVLLVVRIHESTFLRHDNGSNIPLLLVARCNKNGKLASRLQIVGENRGEMGRSLATTDRQDGKATVVGGIANLAR